MSPKLPSKFIPLCVCLILLISFIAYIRINEFRSSQSPAIFTQEKLITSGNKQPGHDKKPHPTPTAKPTTTPTALPSGQPTPTNPVYSPYDLDHDEGITMTDYGIFLGRYVELSTDIDFSQDGIVNILDYNLFTQAYRQHNGF